MNAKDFVTSWKKENEELLKMYMSNSTESSVVNEISSLNLTPEQKLIFENIIDGVLTDTFYSLLLGLDGEANIGGIQMQYSLLDENGIPVSKNGEIELEAWNQFHGEN